MFLETIRMIRTTWEPSMCQCQHLASQVNHSHGDNRTDLVHTKTSDDSANHQLGNLCEKWQPVRGSKFFHRANHSLLTHGICRTLNHGADSNEAHSGPNRFPSSKPRADEEVQRAAEKTPNVVNRDNDAHETGTWVMNDVEKIRIRDQSSEDTLY